MKRIPSGIERLAKSTPTQGGFALPMVLLVLVVLTVMAASSIQIAGFEHQAGSGTLESTKAFYAAEAGAHQVIAEWDSARYDTLTPNPGDSASLDWRTLSDNGTAYRAVIHRVALEKIFGLTVEGSEGPFEAQRRLGLLLRPSFALPKAAVTTRGTVEIVTDALTTIDGNDTVPPGWACDAAGSAVPGVEVAAGTSVSQGIGTLLGDPTVKVDSSMDASRFTDFGSLTYADLVAMADKSYPGGAPPASFGPVLDDGECDTEELNNWGDPLNPAAPCGDYFPIIHFAGEADFQTTGGSAGQGILLVDGRLDLDPGAGFSFYGLIISQGPCEVEHGTRVYGAVMCSNPSSQLQQIDDSTTVRYSSCALKRATGIDGGGVALVQGSWKELTD